MKSDEKNSSYHPDTDGRRTDGQTDGRTGGYNYTVAMDWLPMDTNEWFLQQPEYMV